MKINLSILAILAMGLMFTSCGDDLESTSYDYAFNDGYTGDHATDLEATLTIEELDNGGSMITVELTNTVDGETYPLHAHDAADSAETPNMTPYIEAPNADVFASTITGNGGTASTTVTTTRSFTELTTTYDGFLVVHDPLQDVNTADLSTFLIVSTFAR